MNYKLVALDMDGTTLNSKCDISEDTIKVLKECMDKGVKIVLASGREFFSLEKYVNIIGTKDYQITLNGAVIYDPLNKKRIMESIMNIDHYKEMLDKITEKGNAHLVFDSERYYCDKKIKNALISKKLSDIMGIPVNKVDNYLDIKDPTKIMIIELIESRLRSVQDFLKNDELKIMRTGEHALEIIHKDVSKGNALKHLSEIYKIRPEEIIAIGDSENDIEMIEFAGMGIAMGNAYDHVKEVSNYITTSNDENGVAEALKKFILSA